MRVPDAGAEAAETAAGGEAAQVHQDQATTTLRGPW